MASCATQTLSKGTISSVGAGKDAVTFEAFCHFGDITLDWGTYATNSESCLTNKEPIITVGDVEYAENTFVMTWCENDGDAANVIFKLAHAGTTKEAKTVTIQVEMNNSKDSASGKKGTLYTFNALVKGYTVLVAEGSFAKSQIAYVPLDDPKEVVAEPKKK